MTNGDGASGAVDSAGGAITAERAPNFAEPSAGDEQGRRRELLTKKDTETRRSRAARLNVRESLRNAIVWAIDPTAAKCNSK
ncbi:unnamed protein product [Closterium sp. Yama58-4]|nr:unnamed protein product [Closterium sp. Yama58-4]